MNLTTLKRKAARRVAALPSHEERRAIRQRACIPKTELAQALGVSRWAIEAWESGRYEPQGVNRENYARALTLMSDGVAAAQAKEPA